MTAETESASNSRGKIGFVSLGGQTSNDSGLHQPVNQPLNTRLGVRSRPKYSDIRQVSEFK